MSVTRSSIRALCAPMKDRSLSSPSAVAAVDCITRRPAATLEEGRSFAAIALPQAVFYAPRRCPVYPALITLCVAQSAKRLTIRMNVNAVKHHSFRPSKIPQLHETQLRVATSLNAVGAI